MSNLDVIRAWKDPEYRMGLSATDRALLPAHPAGLIEMSDAQLGDVTGGSALIMALYSGVKAMGAIGGAAVAYGAAIVLAVKAGEKLGSLAAAYRYSLPW